MYTIIVSVLTVVFFTFLYSLQRTPKPIFGIYQQPGKWYYIKYFVFLIIYYYRKHFRSVKYATQHDSGVKGHVSANHGSAAPHTLEDLDAAQPLSEHPKAFDAIFFIGVSQKGFYVVVGCERRQMGICNGPFYVVVPGKGLLCSKKIPDTMLFGADINTFGAEGLLIKPVEPMKKWTISYKGDMWYQSQPDKMVSVDFECEWIMRSPHFNFDTDLSPSALARSIAREPWTREYFNNLASAHQSRYEQFGDMKIKFTLENETHETVLQAFRDHGFGHKRDWTLMHRYIYHHLFLATGQCVALGVICQPCTGSVLDVGFAWFDDDIVPVEWCDLQLYAHGEAGTPPQDYAFRFKAGGLIYTVEVEVEYESTHYVGAEWEARMVERFVRCVVNGIQGRGVSEAHYRHHGGRPELMSTNDPDWYKKIANKV